MVIFIICLAAFLTAILTFFSGFGLGTNLNACFYPVLSGRNSNCKTGVVHFSNNLFKLALVGKNADKHVFVKFGIPAVIASLAGAWLLLKITILPSVLSYHLLDKEFEITPVKLTIAIHLSNPGSYCRCIYRKQAFEKNYFQVYSGYGGNNASHYFNCFRSRYNLKCYR